MKKRIPAILVFCALIVLFLARSLGSWKRFNWPLFWSELRHVRVPLVLLSVVLIYVAFFLRAVRWKVFLSDKSPASVLRLLPPTILGFAGLTLLGRPGELIRPYLIARRENLSLSSQLGVWGIERIFDVLAFAALLTGALALTPSISQLPHVELIRRGILWATIGALVVAGVVIFLSRDGNLSSDRSHSRGRPTSKLLLAVHEMLTAVPDVKAACKAGLLSLVMWLAIALAYYSTIHALRAPLNAFALPEVLILMALSLVGSLAQLPGAGGQQLAVIAGLTAVFSVPAELAVNCGILLWFTTHFAPVPVGLLLLRHTGLSFRALSRESASSST